MPMAKLPPPTPSKLKGKLLGMYERHYAWNYGDDGQPKTNRLSSNSRRRLFSLWTLFAFFCLTMYVILGRLTVHLPEQPPMEEEPLAARPEQIRRVVNTCTRDLPLVTLKPDFFAEADFKRLREDLSHHPAIAALEKRPPREVGTKGLHLTFNTAGISRMTHDPQLAHLFEYFKRVRYLDANAWKLNLFFMDTDPEFTPDDGVFGIHHDTLETNNGFDIRLPGEELEIFSYITSVLYVSFPDDMDGGNLWLWPPKTSIEQDYTNEPPVRVLRPKLNTLVEFRGDAFHGVSGFTSAYQHVPRVSLVLEQFRVPTAMYNVTWEWRKGTYQSHFNLSTIAHSGSYHVLTDLQRRHRLSRDVGQDQYSH